MEKRTVADAVHLRITEDGVLAPVSEAAGLLNVGRRETVSVRLVVGKLGGDVIVQL